MAKAAVKENLPAEVSENLPAATNDFSAFDSGDTGFENVTSKDLIIPRLTILQGLSPQVTQGKPEFDPNAKVGEVYDVGLQERFPEGVVFIPVLYSKAYLEWAPRNSGKGLQGIHNDDRILDDTEQDEKGRPTLKNGNYIVETSQLYGINVTAAFRKCFLPMSSTQLKKARRLLTLATTEKLQRADGSEFTPPLWYRSYSLTTVPESNAEGSWMGWKIERGQALTELPNWQQHLTEIKSFRESLVKGEAKGDLSGVDGDRPATGEDAPM
jgi:hypothetical protein